MLYISGGGPYYWVDLSSLFAFLFNINYVDVYVYCSLLLTYKKK